MKIKGLNVNITKQSFGDTIISITIDEIDFELPNNLPDLKESAVDFLEGFLEGFNSMKNTTEENLNKEKP